MVLVRLEALEALRTFSSRCLEFALWRKAPCRPAPRNRMEAPKLALLVAARRLYGYTDTHSPGLVSGACRPLRRRYSNSSRMPGTAR